MSEKRAYFYASDAGLLALKCLRMATGKFFVSQTLFAFPREMQKAFERQIVSKLIRLYAEH